MIVITRYDFEHDTCTIYFFSTSDLSPSSSHNTGLSSTGSLASCCAILAMICLDPEYRVYITALVSNFRNKASYSFLTDHR